ncbi:hypothetical protein HMPREF2990_01480 [Corynebacterium sp. HMSC071B10]|nr:hypothetical protein HMPREF2990_01480 [Corynebacterium sp. HMSC071B10]
MTIAHHIPAASNQLRVITTSQDYITNASFQTIRQAQSALGVNLTTLGANLLCRSIKRGDLVAGGSNQQ